MNEPQLANRNLSTRTAGSGTTGIPMALAFMFGVALMISGWALITQGENARALEQTIETLSADLAVAEQKLAAQEQRFDPVREQLEDIMTRIGSLQALVASSASAPDTAAGPSARDAESTPEGPALDSAADSVAVRSAD